MFIRKIIRLIVKVFNLGEISQESSVGGQRNFIKIFSIIFLVSILAISAAFFIKACQRAKEKPLWVDEVNGLSSRSTGYLKLIVQGSGGSQVSQSPLDYVLLRFFDQTVGQFLRAADIPLTIYYRLNSMLYSLMSGMIIISLVFFKIKKATRNYFVFILQMGGLILALLFYYFWKYNFMFSIEMRPYSLWNALWFMILTLFMYFEGFKRRSFVLLILIAGTSSSSLFQMFCLACSFIGVQFLTKEGFYEGLKVLFENFTIPVLVILYYIFLNRSTIYPWAGNDAMYWKEFWGFWFGKEMIPILSILGIIMSAPFKQFRSHTIVFSTTLLLFIISPMINHLVLSRGVFFSFRHYIYYDLIYPVFLIHCALILPCYWQQLRQKVAFPEVSSA